MAYCALWLDHDHAKLFKFGVNSLTTTKLENKHLSHHSAANVEGEKREHLKKFYLEVRQSLDGADAVLLVGPGVAKSEFKHYLEEHKAEKILKAIVATETVGKVPDSEILTIAKQHFHKFNLFN